jgi:uncharacterized protein (UPF0335 family)
MPKAAKVEDLFDGTHLGNKQVGQLRSLIERVEKLDEERKALADDIKEIFGEAKGSGFDVKAMRKIVAIRKKDRDKWREEQEQLDLYLKALGLL